MRVINNGERGITLMALVITIIVITILAMVTIKGLTGKDGIITKAKEAKTVYEQEQEKEEIALMVQEFMLQTEYDDLIGFIERRIFWDSWTSRKWR